PTRSLEIWRTPACRPEHREMDLLQMRKPAAKSPSSLWRFGTGSCRNPNDQAIDNARPNFLIWQPENPPAIGSVRGVISCSVTVAGAGCEISCREFEVQRRFLFESPFRRDCEA